MVMTEPEEVIVPETLPELPEGVRLGIVKIEGPHDLIVRAITIATELNKIIEKKKLFTVIHNKRHVWVEGWTAMLSMIGVTPRELASHRFEDGSWESQMGLFTYSGQQVGGASALCGVDETDRDGKKTWAARPEYARKSMAATRATGKAARLSFSWIMVLAGYSATPAEEMDALGTGAEFNDAETEETVAPAEFLVTIKRAEALFNGKTPTMAQLFKKNPEFVSWIAEKIHDKPVGDAARAFLKDHPLPATADSIMDTQSHDKVCEMGNNLSKAIEQGARIKPDDFWMFQRAFGMDQAYANDIRLKHTQDKITDWKASLIDLFLEWNTYMEREGEEFTIQLPKEKS